MRVAYFDLVGGAAGDMLLAALVDAGAPLERLREQLDGLGLGAELRVHEEVRGWLRGRRVEVVAPDEPQPHRHLSDVLEIVARATLAPRARARAERVFRALAEAEGRVHGISPEEVHFHEVGAVDSIVDTVGVVVALELLGVDAVEASPFPLGRGTVGAAHGKIPLPAPAVLNLIEAVRAPVEGREALGELVTPTGAALLTALAQRFGAYPALQVEAVGYGAGTRVNPSDQLPNVCRVVVGEPATVGATGGGERGAPGEVVVLEANLDDQSPELTGYLLEALLEAGAVEAFLTPVLMKKGRPGCVVTALCEPARAGLLEDLLLRESSTLGVRRRVQTRSVLPRRSRAVRTVWGEVRVKETTRPGGRRTVAPEYEDCARIARAQGVALDDVYRAALRAAEAP